ncbi:uncharacterized protein LOC129606477, partial [Condylostylus longicornis]|uniref:uncharacterized protein LOC129606477 n=1 Tax=Condylostylus longicornis TaxID=2530218 RepID=UPI00244D9B0E
MSCNYSDYTVDQYFSQRLSLCVLDTIRVFQSDPYFKDGVNLCFIIESIRNRSFIDGDIESQVLAAIQHLESIGFIMQGPKGFRTLGPFAKLSLAKTQKQ